MTNYKYNVCQALYTLTLYIYRWRIICAHLIKGYTYLLFEYVLQTAPILITDDITNDNMGSTNIYRLQVSIFLVGAHKKKMFKYKLFSLNALLSAKERRRTEAQITEPFHFYKRPQSS